MCVCSTSLVNETNVALAVQCCTIVTCLSRIAHAARRAVRGTVRICSVKIVMILTQVYLARGIRYVYITGRI